MPERPQTSLLAVAPGARGPELEEALERGRILYFAPASAPAPSEEDLVFLREELGERMTLKNISYHPTEGYLSGLHDAALRARVERILREHDGAVRSFLGEVLPDYARDWRVGKVNFRPLQERGRELPRHSSNELLHVDAFASGATHGDRILRFFVNVHPTESRVWKSAGLFPELFAEFGAAAGVAPLDVQRLAEGPADRALSGLLRGAARLGLGRAMMVDTSPYDRAMHRFHNWLKDDDAFQSDEERCVRLEFPPFSGWAVLTDMVSHAAVSGRHALVNTYTVRRERCRVPALSPYQVMASSGADRPDQRPVSASTAR